MQQNILISAQCVDQPSTMTELSKVAANCGCNIVNSRMAVLGNEFSIILLLAGTWDAIAKMENGLAYLERRFGLKTLVSRTNDRIEKEDAMPYSVQVIALDAPGIIHKIASFFEQQDVVVDELYSDTYQASSTSSSMLSLNLTVIIPASCHIASVRERFLILCDDNNYDAIIEPIKS